MITSKNHRFNEESALFNEGIEKFDCFLDRGERDTLVVAMDRGTLVADKFER